MQNEETRWDFPQSNQRLYLKETLGPYTKIEALFNPLDVLLRAGYPPKKLRLFIVGREPLQTWASWLSWWQPVTNVDIFINAYLTTEKIRLQAIQDGFEVGSFIYEANRDFGVKTAIQHLLEYLGINFSRKGLAC